MRKHQIFKSMLCLGTIICFGFTRADLNSNAKRDLPTLSSKAKTVVMAALPTVLNGIWSESATIGSGSMPPMNFVALYPNRCTDAIDAEWQVSPSATITYDSGLDCLLENHTGVRIQFSNSGTYTVSARVKNKDGVWTNWAYTTITKM
ncbi:hypothetical protein [Sphingobacterium sp. DR205]|uniref:hypothetical protein n=1 Tax=Sphingobacterium sp. DR205 TaxID=2713573 RepID=UPI0013E4375A|nr:hypothetical protein [Sphingobacterium sp. DR205]QIH32087.1 hypothetical protein G6053_03855 [Sphingobacterium sp. DR205]